MHMIKTILLYLSWSITLRHVVSFAPRLSEEQLKSFTTNKSFAQSYAMQLCNDSANFWINGQSWESAFGPIGESVYSEDTKLQVDGGQPIVGYNNLKADAYLIRNITQFYDSNCTEDVYNDESLFLSGKIQVKGKNRAGFRYVGVYSETRYFKKYLFKSDGTLKKFQYQTLSGQSLKEFLNVTKHGAKATLAAAQYMGLIEEQIEGSERNIESLTKLVFIILALFGAVIAGCVAYGVNMCLSNYDKQRIKYDAVPQVAVE